MSDTPKKPRRFLLGLVFAGIHSAFFLAVAILVGTSSDGAAPIAYHIFSKLNYPLAGAISGLVSLFLLGGLLWFAYGWIIQSLISIRSRYGVRWLVGGIAFLCGLLLLPELFLRTMPAWEAEWQRGVKATEAGDLEGAIAHVSKAIELSSVDNDILDGMWSYLGQLQMDAKDHDSADRAFHAALQTVESQPSSRPVDHLNAHNQLLQFYWRIEDFENERKHLYKAIEFNRLVYDGDSIQEVNCWARLAEIERQRGISDEALRLLEKAISMQSELNYPHEGTLNHMKEKRDEWAGSSDGND